MVKLFTIEFGMKKNRNILLGLFVLAMLLQVFFIFKRIHNYPFMIYDMYSRKEAPKQYAEVYNIIADGDTLDPIQLPILQEGLILNSLDNYNYFIQHEQQQWEAALNKRQHKLGKWFTSLSNKRLRVNANEMKTYPSWLKSYLENKVLHQKIEKLQVYQTKIDTRLGFNYGDKLILSIE